VSRARKAADEVVEPRHPRETYEFFGHAQAEQALLSAYRSGRMPHAWLIAGGNGIGKATLAYRLARFVLAHPDPQTRDVQAATSLYVDPDHRVSRLMAAQAHSDLLELERTPGDSGKLRTVITVEQVRETVGFFGATAGEGGWRICIVNSVDELQYPQGSNALLKMLEEPPPRALFLLVSHAPGGLLATIRSRCRRLALRPLDASDVARATALALGADPDDSEIQQAAAAADGSVARALMLIEGTTLALHNRVVEMLAALPALDPRQLHALGDMMSGTDAAKLETFLDAVNGWMSARLGDGRGDARRLARLAQVWEDINQSARDVDIYNLERKPLVFSAFKSLAESA